VTLNAEAFGRKVAGTSAASSMFNGQATAVSSTFILEMKTGEVLAKVETAASATSAVFSASTTANISALSIAKITVDGNDRNQVRAIGSASATDSGAADMQIGVTGSANVSWSVAEYNIIKAP
jgi:hypothetical protein